MYRNVPGVFGNQQSNYLVVIKQMLLQSLNVPDSNVSLKFYKLIMNIINF